MTAILLILTLVQAQAIPVEDVELTGYVNDYAGVVEGVYEAKITELARYMDTTNQAEYAVVIVDSLEGMSKEEYALEIAHGQLGDTEEDNGLLLLIAVEEREYRIEVGYGLEGRMTDGRSGQLARKYLVPELGQNNYGRGIQAFTEATYVEITGNETLPTTEQIIDSATVRSKNNNQSYFWTYVLGFFILRAIASAIFNRRRGRGRDTDEALGAAVLASAFLRGGGGNFGGGFGGFGGGGFGGGGAGGGF